MAHSAMRVAMTSIHVTAMVAPSRRSEPREIHVESPGVAYGRTYSDQEGPRETATAGGSSISLLAFGARGLHHPSRVIALSLCIRRESPKGKTMNHGRHVRQTDSQP